MQKDMRVNILYNLVMRKLSLKQMRFISAYLELGNATEAVCHTYNVKDKNVAGVMGYRMLRNVNVSRAIEDILSKAGLSEKAIAKRLKELVNLNSFEGIKLALKLHGYKDI